MRDRLVAEAVVVLTSSTPSAPSLERNKWMDRVAADLLAAIDRPDTMPRLVKRCRSTVRRFGLSTGGDIIDALTHATAVVHEGRPEFPLVIRRLADISARLEPLLNDAPALAVAV